MINGRVICAFKECHASVLSSFRAQNGNYDVWSNLETNWTDFFWLTGETPDTLNVLVGKLHTIYTNVFPMRRGVLDFRNKVRHISFLSTFDNIDFRLSF